MYRKRQPVQQNSIYLWVIGAVAIGVILVVLGVMIGVSMANSGAEQPTALPEGFAQTAIVLTIAAHPTNTQPPTALPTPTALDTNTPLPTLSPLPPATATSAPIAVAQATQYITLPSGTKISSSVAITPIGVTSDCECSESMGYKCSDFRTANEAQRCYDWCRAQTCTDLDSCDPWGLDASDGSLDSEHWVCGYGDSHLK